ncbi:MAG: hypothetical protein CMD83_14765 [Gammaproteobacteria bacterium]|nr:hypothetical protein [Gammaproteobacteria bacterium]
MPCRSNEELRLLALHDSDETPLPGTALQQGLAAALMAELIFQERISLQEPKMLVTVKDSTTTHEPAADECLIRMHGARRRKRLENRVTSISNRGDLRHDIARGLARRGVCGWRRTRSCPSSPAGSIPRLIFSRTAN